MKPNTKLILAFVCSIFLISYACKGYYGGGGESKEPPRIVLTYDELVSMLKHYDATRTQPLANVNKREDTRVNFFKIDELKAYIAYVERESRKKKIKLTGINFISAAYPENWEEDKEKSNYQTLIMMPATEFEGQENVSFDPFISSEEKPVFLKEILTWYEYTAWSYDNAKVPKSNTKKRSKSTQKNGGGDELSAGANRAGISPPL